MKHTTRTTTLSLRLRVVETESDFSDDEPPSLSGVAVVETTGEAVEEPRPLAKAVAPVALRRAV